MNREQLEKIISAAVFLQEAGYVLRVSSNGLYIVPLSHHARETR